MSISVHPRLPIRRTDMHFGIWRKWRKERLPDRIHWEKLLIDLRQGPIYSAFAADALLHLRLAIEGGHLNPADITAICDFGAGSGEPTYAISHVFPGRFHVALENNPVKYEDILQRNILPSENVVIEDGIAELKSGHRKYDLITAVWFYPKRT